MTAATTTPAKSSKKVTAPVSTPEPATTAPATTPESSSTEKEFLTYGEAIKLVARILRFNPNDGGEVLVESIRDVVAGTGLNVDYTPDEQEEESEEQEAA